MDKHLVFALLVQEAQLASYPTNDDEAKSHKLLTAMLEVTKDLKPKASFEQFMERVIAASKLTLEPDLAKKS